MASASDPIEDQVETIIGMMKSYPDSAIGLSHQLFKDASDQDHEYGMVQSNFILGYIYDKYRVDYSKAIIYYLEAIRYAEQATYPNAINNLISVHKNCGVIFKKFNSFELAKSYYKKAIEYAHQIDNQKQVRSLKYNLSGIYRDQNQFDNAISTLHEILEQSEGSSSMRYKTLNRLSFTYFENNDFINAERFSQELIDSKCSDSELLAYSYHIIGKVFVRQQDYHQANKHLFEALSIVHADSNAFADAKAELEVLEDLGTNELQAGNTDKALTYFTEAKKLTALVTQNPEYFNVFKAIANIHFELGNFNEAKLHEDLYAKNLNEYLDLQRQLQETDRSYNMDLITKRYFDEIAKQEQIASILFYSKLISGSLLFLLLLTMGYNWYQKTQLRKSIVRELIDLKIME